MYESALKKLCIEIDGMIASFDTKRRAYGGKANLLFTIQLLCMILSAVFAGLHIEGMEVQLKNWIVVTAALASAVSVATEWFKYRDRWITYTGVASQLHRVKSSIQLELELASSDSAFTIDADRVRKFHAEFQAALDHSDSGWQSMMNAAKVTSEGKSPGGQ